MGVMEVNNLFLIPQSQAQGGAQFKWDVQQLPAMEKGRYPRPGLRLRGGSQLQSPRPGLGAAQAGGGQRGQTDWYRHARFAPSIKSLLGGAYLQEKDAPLNKKAIVDSLLARPMPKSPRWWEMDQGSPSSPWPASGLGRSRSTRACLTSTGGSTPSCGVGDGQRRHPASAHAPHRAPAPGGRRAPGCCANGWRCSRGPGGSGKTRLALAVAEALRPASRTASRS